MLRRILFVPLLLSALVATSSVAETPQSIAAKLQAEFLAAPAVSFSFNLKNEGHIRILTDIRGKRIRMESASTLIISDGTTIWNYDKSADRVTIDDVSSGSEFHDPIGLFRFADNYSARMDHPNGKNPYTLTLTPSRALQSLFHSADELQSLRLKVAVHGSGVTIISASAISSRGEASAQHLQITMLRSVHPSDFIFRPSAKTKVVDLRE